MKVDILETHDRLLQFNKQADNISKGCQDCINSRPEEFGSIPFYIFAHKRELGVDERIALFNQDLYSHLSNPLSLRQYNRLEDVPTARLIWEPRLTRPKAQTNSMLFKYYPEKDVAKICWIIPDQALWNQYTKGKMTEDHTVVASIYNYTNNRKLLEDRDEDDLDDERINQIYREISINARRKKQIEKIHPMPSS